jgi:N-acyl amino acid synthase of PEP-CTERM/exosortase system
MLRTATVSHFKPNSGLAMPIWPKPAQNQAVGPQLLSVQHFTSYFEVLLARSPELLERVYRIRGEVYCKEFKYEPEENCPGGLEQDDYDRHAIHCLIMHRQQQLPAGCVRLVIPPKNAPDFLLPLEKYCASSLKPTALRLQGLPRDSLGEVSRLAVHTFFRRRAGEQRAPEGLAEVPEFSAAEQRTFPLLASALILAATALAKLTGRTHNFAMMEPRLARLLQRVGLNFVQVGELMEYHGPRAAFHITTEQAINGMDEDLSNLYEYIYQRLAAAMRSQGLHRLG